MPNLLVSLELEDYKGYRIKMTQELVKASLDINHPVGHTRWVIEKEGHLIEASYSQGSVPQGRIRINWLEAEVDRYILYKESHKQFLEEHNE